MRPFLAVVVTLICLASSFAWSQQKTRKCRPSGSNYSVRTAHLPVCTSKRKPAAQAEIADLDSEDEFSLEAEFEKSPGIEKSARQERNPEHEAFEAYVANNARQPALSSRMPASHQDAFRIVQPKAVFSLEAPPAAAPQAPPTSTSGTPGESGSTQDTPRENQ